MHLVLRGKSVYVIFRDQYGRKHRRPTGFTLDTIQRRGGKILWPRHLVNFKKQLQAKITLGTWGLSEVPAKKALLLSEAFEAYLSTVGSELSKSTKDLYKLSLRKFVETLGDWYLTEIGTKDMFDFRTKMIKQDGVENTAVWLRHLSPVFNWAAGEEFIHKNPITKKVRLNPPSKLPVCYSIDELRNIFDYADKHFKGLSDQLIFLIFSGFRSGESCRAELPRIHVDRRVIEYYNEKAKRWENHPMDADFIEFLRLLPNDYAPRLFRYTNLSSLNHALKRINVALGHNERYNVHTFKSNAVERWRLMGKDVYEVSRLAHHKSIQTTLRHYAVFNSEIFDDDRERAIRLERLRKILLRRANRTQIRHSVVFSEISKN